jgi:hypothetical protein
MEVRELLLETPGRVATIPHPGVSALKKEHGILQSRPNISDIGKGTVAAWNTSVYSTY